MHSAVLSPDLRCRPVELREGHDWIVTPQIKRAILAQSGDKLFGNIKCVTVTKGVVWFDQVWIGKRWVFQIVVINQMAHRRG